jgi:hypothetical protein
VALIVRERTHDGYRVLDMCRANVYRVEGDRIVEISIFEADQYAVDEFLSRGPPERGLRNSARPRADPARERAVRFRWPCGRAGQDLESRSLGPKRCDAGGVEGRADFDDVGGA